MRETAGPIRQALAPFKRRFPWVAAYFLVILIIGLVGYRITEGWNLQDSLYMALTTVTAVGFMEVHPLSGSGRILTIVLIIFGVTGLGMWWGLTTALILELDLAGVLRRRRIMRKVSEMSQHVIVCGGGRMGKVVVEELVRSEKPFVIIESDSTHIAGLFKEYPDQLIIEGDATKEHTLELAGIERASGLAACLSADADNLLLCLTARGLCPELNIVARAIDEETIDKLGRAGADHAISPNVTGGVRMASMLLRPSVVSFLDVATMGVGDISLRLEQSEIPSGSPIAGRTLADAKIPQRTGLIVLALRRRGERGHAQYNPGPETRLEAGDVMIVLGRQEQVQSLRDYVQGTRT
jgi:voltage-gated potassium channel